MRVLRLLRRIGQFPTEMFESPIQARRVAATSLGSACPHARTCRRSSILCSCTVPRPIRYTRLKRRASGTGIAPRPRRRGARPARGRRAARSAARSRAGLWRPRNTPGAGMGRAARRLHRMPGADMGPTYQPGLRVDVNGAGRSGRRPCFRHAFPWCSRRTAPCGSRGDRARDQRA